HPPPPPLSPPFHVRRPARRGRGWIVAAAVALTLAVAGTLAYEIARFGLPSTGGADPTAEPDTRPPLTRTAAGEVITLPGTSVRITENDSDPLKLTSYTADAGKRLYVRRAGGDAFVRDTRHFEYALRGDGVKALAVDADYGADGQATVSVVDHWTGAKRTVEVSRQPVFPTTPRWSPDGAYGLVTLYKGAAGNAVPHGFAVIDAERGTARAHQVGEPGAGEWRFFWDAGGRAVGTWAGGRMTFYDLDGRLLRTLPAAGTPVWVEGENVAGGRFLAHCDASGKTICVRSTSGGDAAPRVVPFAGDSLIGWWDDDHLAVWRPAGGGYQAVVIDLAGQVTRVLATAADAAEFRRMSFRYSPS
ncbi:hypothetical protein HII36_49710, partial [Nonomuraea sp. NN258]|uniref:hypothetical protein n=1 Tax=Nonomuraea antri TaxID=2730852 RepID=UPI00156932BA